MMKTFSNDGAKEMFLERLRDAFPNTAALRGCDIAKFASKNGYPNPGFLFKPENRADRGMYYIGSAPVVSHQTQPEPEAVSEVAMAAPVIQMSTRRAATVTDSFVPDKNPIYVPFGFYSDLKKIISSKVFYPVYVTGLSGNGKTLMIEQVCANLGRELIRVNITKETDETDLIGSYELIDGNTVRREGPVLVAMRRGAVLLMDETDYGSERLLCLQPILEGKPYFDKKTGEVIHPAKGFNIMATANTKGKGSDDGRFIGANVLNEAFLDRFAITVEQEYPKAKVEESILLNNFNSLGIKDDDFASKLVNWAEVIRRSFEEGAVDEIVSTRRLVRIAEAYAIFKNKKKAITLALNRFDSDTKAAFFDLYEKLDENANVSIGDAEPASAEQE